ncbi:MAG: TetR family transcriptional regulator [Actinobacteria bacterium]|nr:TetR family transcriptional regulator [Actinomycetota bacterium]
MAEHTKSSGVPTRPRRPQVRGEQARELLIEATITLLRAHPFDEVTTRRISAATGLNVSVIVRNFGTVHQLLRACCERLVHGALARTGQIGNLAIFLDPDVVLRNRLLAWMIGEGYDPNQESLAQQQTMHHLVEQFHSANPVSEHAARIWMLFITTTLAGYTLFGELSGITAEDFNDIGRLAFAFRDRLPAVADELGL